MNYHRYLHARPAVGSLDTVPSEINAAQKARGLFGHGAGAREQGPRMKRSSIAQLKLCTRCGRCRKIGFGLASVQRETEDSATTRGTTNML